MLEYEKLRRNERNRNVKVKLLAKKISSLIPHQYSSYIMATWTLTLHLENTFTSRVNITPVQQKNKKTTKNLNGTVNIFDKLFIVGISVNVHVTTSFASPIGIILKNSPKMSELNLFSEILYGGIWP